ncbi:HGGxSTG domain-containing protein [Novosphingobium sp.]|uniref:HGGxSTG domain-containing protein n=1 Tax=Novosphingobium sp. TaxID=1874826 RepID=UPI003455FFFA
MEAKPKDGRPALLTNAPLCQARTRAGGLCRCPAVKGKARCRIHGGAKGSGAPSGERNGAWKHGGSTNEVIALRREAGQLMKAVRD